LPRGCAHAPCRRPPRWRNADESPENRLSAAFAGRYRIERELGAGGMATVCLAHDSKHDCTVAIRILREELSASLGGDRVLREIALPPN